MARRAVWVGSLAIAAVALGGGVHATEASADLAAFYSAVGTLRLSTDAVGTNEPAGGVVQVDKHAGATVRKAFLFGASTGFTGFTPPDGRITIDGAGVTWDPSRTRPSGISSVNVAADVTDMIKAKIDSAPAGRVNFTVAEGDSANAIDGEVLVVVFDDPSVATNTIQLMYGAQQTGGDHFAIGLGAPLKPSTQLSMGLGISFGYQVGGTQVQYSTVEVNDTLVTSSAGGQDDGEPEDGALITAGGLDDTTDNPTDASAQCVVDARCDDELYNLKPFTQVGDTSVSVDTLNPSNDDNIFLATLQLSAAALVGGGIVLTPSDGRVQVGSGFQFFTALAQDGDGHPVSGKTLTLKVLSGPSVGLELSGVTDSRGKANFNYLSTSTGTDTIRVSYTDAEGTHTSNEAAFTWAPAVASTFGGEWPFHGSLDLYYTYGGGHRYLGNVVKGAQNWNDAGTNVHLAEWPGVPFAVQIPIADVDVNDTWFGQTIWTDEGGCITCTYNRVSIQMNKHMLDRSQFTDEMKSKVATHEFGHAIGLAHTEPPVSNDTPSVMRQGFLSNVTKSWPQSFDINRVRGMYP